MQGSSSNVATVNFFTKFTSSEQFEKVFREGMSLVEETANYLDGPGRLDARVLERHGAIAYATESMRLTTRLMQLASWLLLLGFFGLRIFKNINVKIIITSPTFHGNA